MKISYLRAKQHHQKRTVVFLAFIIAVALLAHSMKILFFFTLWSGSLLAAGLILLLFLKYVSGTDYLSMILFHLSREYKQRT